MAMNDTQVHRLSAVHGFSGKLLLKEAGQLGRWTCGRPEQLPLHVTLLCVMLQHRSTACCSGSARFFHSRVRGQPCWHLWHCCLPFTSNSICAVCYMQSTRLPCTVLQVTALVESLLHRMRYIPQPDAQERYLAGAVGVVLEQALGRITRMLQQAEVFRDITSYSWLPRVGLARVSDLFMLCAC